MSTLEAPIGVNEILQAILALLTAIYVVLMFRMLRANEAVVAAMRAEREAATRPYVTVAALTLPKDPRIYLRIENTGRTAAKKLRLSLDRPFHAFGDADSRYNLQTYPAFAEQIESFGSRMRLVFTLAVATDLFSENAAPAALVPSVFHVTARYEWDGGSSDETSAIDLRPYPRSDIQSDPMVEALGKIKEAIEKKRP
jgi:hypothetical protein